MVVYLSMQQIFKSIFFVSLATFTVFCLLNQISVIQINAYKITPKDSTQKFDQEESVECSSVENDSSGQTSEKPVLKPREEIEIDDFHIDDYLLFQVPKFCPPGQTMDGKGRCRKKVVPNNKKASLN